MGVWSFFLSKIEDKIELSDAELGTAVLFVYLGMVMVSPITAFMLQRLGSQISVSIGALSFGITLSFIPLSTSLGVLIVTMLVYGCSMGIMDISMNSCAILTEIVAGKPLFGSFHGSYSIAAAIGSLLGAGLASTSLSISTIFGILSITSVILTIIFLLNMYNSVQEQIISDFKNETYDPHEDMNETLEYSPFLVAEGTDNDGLPRPSLESPLMSNDDYPSLPDYTSDHSSVELDGPSTPISTRSKRIIAFYSFVGFLAAFGESSMVTWSIVYYDRALHATSVMKSLGFTSFMICMALGRFTCDFLRSYIGRKRMVRMSGILASIGLGLVVLAPDLPCGIAFACIGFSFTGCGLSYLIPTMFSSAGHIPGGVHAGTSIAIVSMFTNCGAIISSPLVGVLSDTMHSMRLAFLVVAVLFGLFIPLSFGIPEEHHVFRRYSVDSGGGRRTSKEEFVVQHSLPTGI